jgi:hypothetical protein
MEYRDYHGHGNIASGGVIVALTQAPVRTQGSLRLLLDPEPGGPNGPPALADRSPYPRLRLSHPGPAATAP